MVLAMGCLSIRWHCCPFNAGYGSAAVLISIRAGHIIPVNARLASKCRGTTVEVTALLMLSQVVSALTYPDTGLIFTREGRCWSESSSRDTFVRHKTISMLPTCWSCNYVCNWALMPGLIVVLCLTTVSRREGSIQQRKS